MKSPSRVERGPKRKAWASLLLLTVHTAHQLLPAVYYLMLLQFQLLIQAWSSNIQNELHVYLCASLLVFFLVFHLLTLAYHRQAAAPNLTKWVDLLPDWNVDQTSNAVFLWSLARKKILICKPQCWINAAFYPANFHILPQAHTSWHTVHGTKFNMFVTLFKMLHEKFMSIDLVWELLPVSLYSAFCRSTFSKLLCFMLLCFLILFTLWKSALSDGHVL